MVYNELLVYSHSTGNIVGHVFNDIHESMALTDLREVIEEEVRARPKMPPCFSRGLVRQCCLVSMQWGGG
jgi:hypothetical protein